MQEKYLTENIKLSTECLRGFFAVLILDSTAIATILIRQKFLTNNFEYYLLFISAIFFLILLAIVIIFYKITKRNINLLKQ